MTVRPKTQRHTTESTEIFIVHIILPATNTLLIHLQNYIKNQIQPFSYRVQGSVINGSHLS